MESYSHRKNYDFPQTLPLLLFPKKDEHVCIRYNVESSGLKRGHYCFTKDAINATFLLHDIDRNIHESMLKLPLALLLLNMLKCGSFNSK